MVTVLKVISEISNKVQLCGKKYNQSDDLSGRSYKPTVYPDYLNHFIWMDQQ